MHDLMDSYSFDLLAGHRLDELRVVVEGSAVRCHSRAGLICDPGVAKGEGSEEHLAAHRQLHVVAYNLVGWCHVVLCYANIPLICFRMSSVC